MHGRPVESSQTNSCHPIDHFLLPTPHHMSPKTAKSADAPKTAKSASAPKKANMTRPCKAGIHRALKASAPGSRVSKQSVELASEQSVLFIRHVIELASSYTAARGSETVRIRDIIFAMKKAKSTVKSYA